MYTKKMFQAVFIHLLKKFYLITLKTRLKHHAKLANEKLKIERVRAKYNSLTKFKGQ